MDFTVDEKGYLNRCAEEMSKEAFLARLNFHLIASKEHEDVYIFLSALKEKIANVTDDEWSALQEELPYMLPYGKYDTEEYARFEDRT